MSGRQSLSLFTYPDRIKLAVTPEATLACHTYNTVSEVRTEFEYPYDSLDPKFKALFDSVDDLFEALGKLKDRAICVAYRDERYYLEVEFEVATRLRVFSLALYVVTPQVELQDYKQRLEKAHEENRKMRVENDRLTEKVDMLELQMEKAQSRAAEQTQLIKQLQQQVKEAVLHQGQLMPMLPCRKKAVVSHTQQIADCIFPFERMPEVSILKSTWSSYFDIAHSRRVRLVKQFKDYHQVVVEEPIRLDKRTALGVRVVNSASMNVYYGVMLEGRRQEKYTCQHVGAIGYKLAGGKFLFENGQQSGEEVPKVKEGETLTLLVDPPHHTVTWILEKRFSLNRQLPSAFIGKPLSFFVSLHDMNDEIEFI